MNDFSRDLAIALSNSTDEFPVDFDDAWQCLGYSNKQAAKKKLTRNFKENEDYLINLITVSHNGKMSASKAEAIKITVECFNKLKISKQKKRIKEEERIQELLQKQTRGETEVITPMGRIDLLTSTAIVEIKDVRQWKAALGQILVYHNYYPSHKMILVLFGASHSSFKETVEYHCSKFNIEVRWYNK
jgi:hypothetical protein